MHVDYCYTSISPSGLLGSTTRAVLTHAHPSWRVDCCLYSLRLPHAFYYDSKCTAGSETTHMPTKASSAPPAQSSNAACFASSLFYVNLPPIGTLCTNELGAVDCCVQLPSLLQSLRHVAALFMSSIAFLCGNAGRTKWFLDCTRRGKPHPKRQTAPQAAVSIHPDSASFVVSHVVQKHSY